MYALHSLLHLWIGSVPLRRGTGLGSAVDKLRHQDFLCLGFAGVHQPHPLHGIAGFQFLGGSRFLRQLGHHLLQSALGGLVDLQKVRVQLLAQQHLVVEDGTVLLQMEDKLLKYFPAEIEKQTGYIHGFEADIKTVEAHPQIADGFCGMEIMGKAYTEKADAGEILLAACKDTKSADPVPLGSYRGFQMELSFDSFRNEFDVTLKGAVSHRVALGTDARGNITRLDNALAGMLRDYKLVQNQHKQLAGNSYIDDDLIFDHEDGTHISSQYADDMFRSLYEPLGLPKVDLYSLRHFSITKKLDYNRHDYVSLAKDTAHRQLSTIQDYYETPEDSVRIDTAKAIGKFLSRSGKSDSESKVTISLADEDFAKKLEEVASDSAGKQMLEFAIAMYEKNNSGK